MDKLTKEEIITLLNSSIPDDGYSKITSKASGVVLYIPEIEKFSCLIEERYAKRIEELEAEVKRYREIATSKDTW
jgi:hypothetical protein